MATPIADFNVNITGYNSVFTDLSLNSPNSWIWDFDDPSSGINNSSNLQHPSHNFTQNGLYNVKLTAINGSGSNFIIQSIQIAVFVNELVEQSSTKLTHETDDIRPSIDSSVIQDSDGRKIVFYHKNLKTGKVFGGIVSTPGGLNVSIESGSGILNGNTTTWSNTNLVAAPSLFQMVYADPTVPTGSIIITSNITMTLTKNIIPLAFLFCGSISIIRIHNLENDGNYIYARRQKPDGFGGWIWDDKEDILNSGKQPQVIYEPLTNRIYLTYTKDSAVYQRIIEVGNETNAWEFLLDYDILTGPQISLNNDPSSEIQTDSSASDNLLNTFDPFNFSSKILGFQTLFLNPGYNFTNKYLFMPYIKIVTGTQGVEIEPLNYQIYTGQFNNQILSDSFNYNTNVNTWKSINSINGNFYLGWTGYIKIFGRRLSYTLPIQNRLKIFIESTYSEISGLSSSKISSKIHQSTNIVKSSSSDVLLDIVATFGQIYNTTIDDILEQQDSLMGSCSDVSEVIETFDQIYEIKIDDILEQQDSLSGSCSDAHMVVV